MKNREQIYYSAEQTLDEIKQLFNDTDYWNRNVRKPWEPVIDPDPGAELAKLKASIESLLVAEASADLEYLELEFVEPEG